MHKKLSYTLCALLAAVLLACAPVFSAAALADEQGSEAAKAAVSQLAGKTAGVMTGTPQDTIVKDNVENAQIYYFNSLTDMILALQSGTIDFLCVSSVNYYMIAADYPDLGFLDCPLKTFDVGAVFPQTSNGDALRTKFNGYIAQIKSSGELEKLQDYWLMPRDWENIDIPQSGENGVIHMATSNTMKPFSMDLNGQNAGFDIAVVAGFCKANGYGLQIDNVDFSGALTGISTGMYDIAAGQISYTDERAQSVNFSDFYYTQQLVPIVRAKDFPAGTVTQASSTQGSSTDSPGTSASGQSTDSSSAGEKSLWTSIRRTLVDQDRWKSILSGLGTTVLITLAGFALANVLGALLCAMSLSPSRALRVISRVYSGLMQGLPIVVVLMILYYVVFGSAKLSNVLVASLGFGFIFAANMGQLFEGAISGVDQGQWEAALASGLTNRQAFLGIILPQAARASVTTYFTNLISLMKGTAIVGYIAVADLTKAGDVIRSATYEAFVPIITVAIIYLALTCMIIGCMTLVKRALTRTSSRKAGEQA